MTELDLDAIKARADAASAGPWTAERDGLVWAPRLGDPVSGSTEMEDAEFIAAARADVPALVAEVERLQRLLGEPFPTSDAYESLHQALADERAEVVRHCDRIAELTALLAEVLGSFPPPPYRDVEVHSCRVRAETVDRWRSHLAGRS